MATDAKGRFIWYECLTPDPVTADAFYREVVGWGRTVWDQGDEPYVMFTHDEIPIAGILEMPEETEAPPHWLGYIHVPDLESYGEKAEGLGAKRLFGPDTIPEVGTMSVFTDPNGAPFALYQPESAPEQLPEETEPGQVSWHEHMTTDWETAFDFYSELVGWEETSAMDMGEMGTYQMFGAVGFELGGMMTLPEDAEAPPNWLYYFQVAKLDEAVGKVKDRGGEVVNGPMEVPGGDRVAVCTDPAGIPFGLHERPA